MFSPSTSSTSYGGINVSFIHIESYTILPPQHVPCSRDAVFSFLIDALFDFLQLECEGKDSVSSLQKHPKIMWVAVSCLLLFCFAYEAEPIFTGVGMGFFGSILSVSLASLLFGNSVLLLLYFLCVLFSKLRRWLHQRTIVDLSRSINRRWFTVPTSPNQGGLQPERDLEAME